MSKGGDEDSVRFWLVVYKGEAGTLLGYLGEAADRSLYPLPH